MQDSQKFLKTRLVVDKKMLFRLICSPLFHSLTTLADGVWEVSSKIARPKINNLLQIAFFVYASAKVIMLNFVYNFIDKYLTEMITSWDILIQIRCILPGPKPPQEILKI